MSRGRFRVAALAAALLVLPLAPVRAASIPAYVGISSARFHTCAVTGAGGVECWGHNDAGQLGNGTLIDSYTPIDVPDLRSGVRATGGGDSHRCALLVSTGVKCWGSNEFGQLGIGSPAASLRPVDVPGLTSGIGAIAVGAQHTCALTLARGVWCWGRNNNVQLGDGTNVDRRTPVAVPGLGSGVVAITAGAFHTCALTITGGVKCWGPLAGATPADVPGLSTGVIAIAAGHQHTCAITTAGGLQCWGSNVAGQLGDGTTTSSATPVTVAGLTDPVVAVTGGYLHTCALMATGGVKCWGRNFEGQLGDGTNTDRTTPVDVVGLSSGVIAVSAGVHYTCVLTNAGAGRCWGRNEYGQLGNGTRGNHNTPVDLAYVIQQTLVFRASRSPGTVTDGRTLTFTATVRPFRPPGTQPTVRFSVHRLVGGVWRLAAQRDVAADPADNDRARLAWTFSGVGSQWYVRARVLGDGVNLASPWSVVFRYRVT